MLFQPMVVHGLLRESVWNDFLPPRSPQERPGRLMSRAFSPGDLLCDDSRGVAPGWDRIGLWPAGRWNGNAQKGKVKFHADRGVGAHFSHFRSALYWRCSCLSSSSTLPIRDGQGHRWSRPPSQVGVLKGRHRARRGCFRAGLSCATRPLPTARLPLPNKRYGWTICP